MRRRALLATAATALPTFVAGCTTLDGHTAQQAVAEAPTARLELTTIPDAKLPTRVLYTVRPDGEDAQLLDRALDGGATTKDTRPPLPEGQHLVHRTGIYELSHEVIEETPATTYSVKVDIVTGSVTAAEAIQFSDLPQVDRDEFAAHGLEDGDVVGIGTTFRYTDAERDQSVLVPESEYAYITWANGAEAEWVVDDAFDTTLFTYRYTAEQVMTAAEYGRRMRERFAFELSGLPGAQREILQSAIDDEDLIVGPDETPSDAFFALADRFRAQEQARALDETGEETGDGENDPSGTYLVRYEGEVYWTRLVVRPAAYRTATPR